MVWLVRLIADTRRPNLRFLRMVTVANVTSYCHRSLLVMLAILVACTSERRTTFDQSHLEKLPERPNVTITAPVDLVGGEFVINDADRHMLWPDTLIDRPRRTFWRRVFG